MFDRVIRDPDWRAALHGRPIMRAEYAGEVFFICPAIGLFMWLYIIL